MPSVSRINVVAEAPPSYIAFEGNGRLEAVRQVVAGIPGVLVEVARNAAGDLVCVDVGAQP